MKYIVILLTLTSCLSSVDDGEKPVCKCDCEYREYPAEPLIPPELLIKETRIKWLYATCKKKMANKNYMDSREIPQTADMLFNPDSPRYIAGSRTYKAEANIEFYSRLFVECVTIGMTKSECKDFVEVYGTTKLANKILSKAPWICDEGTKLPQVLP